MNEISVLLALTCIFLLGASRLKVSIRMTAVQGLLLGLGAILHSRGELTPEIWGIGLTSMLLKGIILPWLLMIALRRSGAKLEIEPYVGFSTSVFCGVLLLGLSSWIAWRSHVIGRGLLPELFATALFLLLTGLFLIVTRRKAITQTLGYLVMENGVYALGLGIGQKFSFLIEIGMLLDVFVGVFLMGIMIFHIDREFEHTDVDRFTELSDLAVALDSSAAEKESVE